MNAVPKQERRQSQRARLSAPGILLQGGRTMVVRLEDVSQGGALLSVDIREGLPSDREASSLRIAFGRDPEEAISVLVRIVDLTDQSVRVQWQEPLPPEDWAKLRQLMEREFGMLAVVQGRLPMLVWPSFPSRAKASRV